MSARASRSAPKRASKTLASNSNLSRGLTERNQHFDPGGQVCSGFFSLLGRAVLPVTSLDEERDCAAPAVLGEACPGAQLAPAGHVASGFWAFGLLGVVVWADAEPATNSTAVLITTKSLDMTISDRLIKQSANRTGRGWFQLGGQAPSQPRVGPVAPVSQLMSLGAALRRGPSGSFRPLQESAILRRSLGYLRTRRPPRDHRAD